MQPGKNVENIFGILLLKANSIVFQFKLVVPLVTCQTCQFQVGSGAFYLLTAKGYILRTPTLLYFNAFTKRF
jgi:hypothetical protein